MVRRSLKKALLDSVRPPLGNHVWQPGMLSAVGPLDLEEKSGLGDVLAVGQETTILNHAHYVVAGTRQHCIF